MLHFSSNSGYLVLIFSLYLYDCLTNNYILRPLQLSESFSYIEGQYPVVTAKNPFVGFK